MENKSTEFIKILLRDKKLRLGCLHDEHRIAIAVYDAKREMMLSDIDMLERQLTADKE